MASFVKTVQTIVRSPLSFKNTFLLLHVAYISVGVENVWRGLPKVWFLFQLQNMLESKKDLTSINIIILFHEYN